MRFDSIEREEETLFGIPSEEDSYVCFESSFRAIASQSALELLWNPTGKSERESGRQQRLLKTRFVFLGEAVGAFFAEYVGDFSALRDFSFSSPLFRRWHNNNKTPCGQNHSDLAMQTRVKLCPK